jgi:hypothetical protein
MVPRTPELRRLGLCSRTQGSFPWHHVYDQALGATVKLFYNDYGGEGMNDKSNKAGVF